MRRLMKIAVNMPGWAKFDMAIEKYASPAMATAMLPRNRSSLRACNSVGQNHTLNTINIFQVPAIHQNIGKCATSDMILMVAVETGRWYQSDIHASVTNNVLVRDLGTNKDDGGDSFSGEAGA